MRGGDSAPFSLSHSTCRATLTPWLEEAGSMHPRPHSLPCPPLSPPSSHPPPHTCMRPPAQPATHTCMPPPPHSHAPETSSMSLFAHAELVSLSRHRLMGSLKSEPPLKIFSRKSIRLLTLAMSMFSSSSRTWHSSKATQGLLHERAPHKACHTREHHTRRVT